MKRRTAAPHGGVITTVSGRAGRAAVTVAFSTALLAATVAVNPAFAEEGTAKHRSGTVTTDDWTGPDPHDAPGPLTEPGRTYPDDLAWPDDTQPDAISDGPAGRGGPCDGETRGHRVKTYRYVQGENTMPLRCGHWTSGSGWGWRKLKTKDRWSTWWDGMIGATLQNPRDTRTQGTSKTYWTRWFEECNPVYRFKVLTETKTYGDGKQGVLNAYLEYR
ncbi:hypothetical protein [Streptomyces capparidis]